MNAHTDIAPSVVEHLCSAAFTILTDGYVHSDQATRWAMRYLRKTAGGRRTAFQRHLTHHSARVRAFAEGAH